MFFLMYSIIKNMGDLAIKAWPTLNDIPNLQSQACFSLPELMVCLPREDNGKDV